MHHEQPSRKELRALLAAADPISLARVEEWIATNDLEVWWAVYELVTRGYNRIRPEIGRIRSGEFLLDYYLGCISEPAAETDDRHTPYEAADELVWFLERVWLGKPSTAALVDALAERVEPLYREGDQSRRDCIEMKFLEHALECTELRSLFAHWAQDAELRDAFERALKWGLAHERSLGDDSQAAQ